MEGKGLRLKTILWGMLGVFLIILGILLRQAFLCGIGSGLLLVALQPILDNSLSYQGWRARHSILLRRMNRVWNGIMVIFGALLILVMILGCISMIGEGNWQEPLFFLVVLLGSIIIIAYVTRHRRWLTRRAKIFGERMMKVESFGKGSVGTYDLDMGLTLVYYDHSKQLGIKCNYFPFTPFSEEETFFPVMEGTVRRLKELSPEIELRYYATAGDWFGKYSVVMPKRIATVDLLKRIRPILKDASKWENEFFCIHVVKDGIHYYGEIDYEVMQVAAVFEDGGVEFFDKYSTREDDKGMSDEMFWFFENWEENLTKESIITPEEFNAVWEENYRPIACE